MDIVLDRLLRRVCPTDAAGGAAVISLTDENHTVVLAAVGSFAPLIGPRELPPGSPLERSARTGQTVRASGAALRESGTATVASLGLGAVVITPLRALDGRRLGLLALGSGRQEAFPESEGAALELFAGAVADVLDRHDAVNHAALLRQVEVTESEHRFRAFMSALPAVAWIKDHEGRFTFLNEQFERLWRVSAAELVGKTDHDFLADEVASAVRDNDTLVRRDRQVVRMEERVPTPDGSVHVWWSTKFPIERADGRIHVGGVALDITARKAAEAELRQSEANPVALKPTCARWWRTSPKASSSTAGA